MVDNGADCLELGFPFSDPCADGPTIQYADKRALASGAVTADFFRLIKELRACYPSLPMSILVYANVAVAHGIDNFYKYAEESGLDAVLIPDKPGELVRVASVIARAQGNVIKLDHNQFVSTNRNAAVELKITLEAFGTDHKNEIVKALEDAGCRPKVIRPSL